MKKYVKYFFVFVCIIFLSVSIKWYFTPVPLYDIISKQIEIAAIKNINVNIYTSVHLIKPYEINERTTIDDLTNVFNNVKVRRTIFPPDTFKPLLYDTYYIVLSNKEKAVGVNFLDKNYLTLNKYTYKIVNKPELKQFYDIAITSEIRK